MLNRREWPLLEELEDPGKGGEGSPSEEDPKPKAISVDVLPEGLRDKSPAEIKFLLERMSEGVVTSNETAKELRQRLAQLEESVKNPPKPAEPDPDDEISDEELIVKDPDKAVMRILKKRGMVDQFAQMGSQVGETVLITVGAKIPGFDEYEQDVRKLLRESNSPIDEAHIKGALKMVIGDRVLEERAKNSRKAGSLETPKDDSDEKKKFSPLEGLEKDIFEASGMDRETYERLKTDDYIPVKVPT